MFSIFSKIDEEKNSLDFEHMNGSGNNPFGESGAEEGNNSILSRSDFTMDGKLTKKMIVFRFLSS